MMAEVKYEEITDKGLKITTKEGERLMLQADTIVCAVVLSPNTGLANILKRKVAEIYIIGDCQEPRLIIDAISDGYRTSSLI